MVKVEKRCRNYLPCIIAPKLEINNEDDGLSHHHQSDFPAIPDAEMTKFSPCPATAAILEMARKGAQESLLLPRTDMGILKVDGVGMRSQSHGSRQ